MGNRTSLTIFQYFYTKEERDVAITKLQIAAAQVTNSSLNELFTFKEIGDFILYKHIENINRLGDTPIYDEMLEREPIGPFRTQSFAKFYFESNKMETSYHVGNCQLIEIDQFGFVYEDDQGEENYKKYLVEDLKVIDFGLGLFEDFKPSEELLQMHKMSPVDTESAIIIDFIKHIDPDAPAEEVETQFHNKSDLIAKLSFLKETLNVR